MGQISPRVFEAAAMRTPMILFTGRYLGLIEPDEHYIELKKDFSNIDAVLGRLDDLDGLERLADRTYDRLVGSGDFSYRRFVERIDACLFRKAAELDLKLRPPWSDMTTAMVRAAPGALSSLCEHPTKAPRHSAFFRYKIVARLQAEIVQHQAEIARLNARLQEEIFQHQAEIARHTNEINLLKVDLEHVRHVLDEYRSRLYWLRVVYKLYKTAIATLGKVFRPLAGRHT
jgi:hypothetical protein